MMSFGISRCESVSKRVSSSGFGKLAVIKRGGDNGAGLLGTVEIFFRKGFGPSLCSCRGSGPRNIGRKRADFTMEFAFSRDRLSSISRSLDRSSSSSSSSSVVRLNILKKRRRPDGSVSFSSNDSGRRRSGPARSENEGLDLESECLRLFGVVSSSELDSPRGRIAMRLAVSGGGGCFCAIFGNCGEGPRMASSVCASIREEFVRGVLSDFRYICVPSSGDVSSVCRGLLIPCIEDRMTSTVGASIRIVRSGLLRISRGVAGRVVLDNVSSYDFVVGTPPSLSRLFNHFRISVGSAVRGIVSDGNVKLRYLSLFSSFGSVSREGLALNGGAV